MSLSHDDKPHARKRYANRHSPVHWAKALFDAGQRKRFSAARRHERRANRHISRSHCKLLRLSEFDDLDEIAPPDPVHRERKEQGDYLAPLYNFLESHVGRLWDDTYSILASRTNRNSTVGDHLWLHMWQYVERETHRIEKYLAAPTYRWFGFYVDRDGLLRRFADGDKHRFVIKWTTEQRDRERAKAAFGATKIVLAGDTPYWGEMVRICHMSGRATYRQGHILPKGLCKVYFSLSLGVRREWTYSRLDEKLTPK